MARELLEQTESECVGHESCPSCGSKDNLARYSDGGAHCFGGKCDYHEPPSNKVPSTSANKIVDVFDQAEFVHGECVPLGKRGINQRTCEKYGYEVAEYKGRACQAANFYVNGKRVAQKLRFANKKFQVIGEGKKLNFFGQHLFNSGKKLVITEGEIDALSVSQIQENKWPVVSIPNGVNSAAKCVQNNTEWLSNFDEVIFMFDMDDVGQDSAREAAALCKPNQAKIASLPLKDANEMLLAKRGKEVVQAIWNAKKYSPAGIISGVDTWERLQNWKIPKGYPYPWPELQAMLHDIRMREITTFTSGSGLGKSTICRELATAMVLDNIKVGYVALEESVERSTLGFMSIYQNKPLHLSPLDFDNDPELRAAWEATAGNGNLELYDHFGSLGSSSLLEKIRYLRVGAECDYIFLDHLSIVVSGMETNDERKTIDLLMTNLRSLVEETEVGLILVSHLRKPEGKSHEEGGRVSLTQLRGSGSIGQLSDSVVGLERNQQGDEPNELKLRVLKNRWAGTTGLADTLTYDHDTGRLTCYGGMFDD